jgi:hypothetical protein
MEHEACNITMTVLGTALSASIGLNVVAIKKIIQQGGQVTRLAAASYLLNEKLTNRLSIRTSSPQSISSSDSCPTPRSPV